MEESLLAFGKGLALNAGLIIAIGAQNAFVLAAGLARRFVGIIALTSSAGDALLIGVGIVFAGAAQAAGAAAAFALAGAAYLCWFGFRSARACIRAQSLAAADSLPRTFRGAFVASLALSLLNPHAVLDMAVVFGGVAAKLPAAQKIPFASGGVCISFLWFFALGFGARQFAPYLQKPIAWRIINGAIAVIMFAIAFSLLRGVLA